MPKRGFTLIELLVVIAIIGILSAVVLAALGLARKQGSDAAIQSNMGTLRSQAALFNDSHGYVFAKGSYASTPAPGIAGSSSSTHSCPTAALATTTTQNGLMADPQFFTAVNAAKAAGGGYCYYNNQANSWAVGVQLKTDKSKGWCVDSTGAAKIIDNAGTAYTATTFAADITAACGS